MLAYFILLVVMIVFLGYFLTFYKEQGRSLFFGLILAFCEFLIGIILFTILLVIFNKLFIYENNKTYILILTIIIIDGFILFLLNKKCIFKKYNLTASIITISEYIIQCVIIFLAVMQATYQYLENIDKTIRGIDMDVINLAVLPTLISVVIGIVLYKLVENKI